MKGGHPVGGGRPSAFPARPELSASHHGRSGPERCHGGERATGALGIAAGTARVLDRDGDGEADRLLEPYDNLSRRHPTLRVDAGGRAWIRDKGSTNGSHHQERRIAAGRWVALRHGDRLRLASDVPVDVRAVFRARDADGVLRAVKRYRRGLQADRTVASSRPSAAQRASSVCPAGYSRPSPSREPSQTP
ncbi:FHA domain-containing protein [Streptomyces sp. NPDC001537]